GGNQTPECIAVQKIVTGAQADLTFGPVFQGFDGLALQRRLEAAKALAQRICNTPRTGGGVAGGGQTYDPATNAGGNQTPECIAAQRAVAAAQIDVFLYGEFSGAAGETRGSILAAAVAEAQRICNTPTTTAAAEPPPPQQSLPPPPPPAPPPPG